MNPVHTETDVVYASIAGRELRCDLHWSVVTPGPLTVAIYLHGGGWARGSRSDRAEERLVPVAGAGIAVASIEYRLSGEARWPAQLEDVRAAIVKRGIDEQLATRVVNSVNFYLEFFHKMPDRNANAHFKAAEQMKVPEQK